MTLSLKGSGFPSAKAISFKPLWTMGSCFAAKEIDLYHCHPLFKLSNSLMIRKSRSRRIVALPTVAYPVEI